MSKSTTLRLLMPQWQGGDVPNAYPLGARLTQWLAPKTDAVTVEVPTIEPDGSPRTEQDGIVERRNLMRQLHSAQEYNPEIYQGQPPTLLVFVRVCFHYRLQTTVLQADISSN